MDLVNEEKRSVRMREMTDATPEISGIYAEDEPDIRLKPLPDLSLFRIHGALFSVSGG
jgi:hypothetical protein